MKKIIIFIAFIGLVYSNTIFSQNLEIIYHADYVANAAIPNNIKSDRMILVIGDKSSVFYSLLADRLQALQDSMIQKGFAASDIQREKAKLPRSSQSYRIFKNYPQKGKLTYTDFLLSWYKYEENAEKPVWKVENETRNILDYKCQKATTTFRGRLWIAWFTPLIPIQEGPWKLWGLPGLILEANDTNNLYTFKAIGIKKANNIPDIAIPKRQYISCKREDFFRLKKESVNDPASFVSKSMGAGVKIVKIEDESGKKIEGKEYIGIETDLK